MITLKKATYLFVSFFALALSLRTMAAPIDVNGALGFDTTMLQNFRRIDSKTDNSTNDPGTQEVKYGGKDNAQFQSYIFRLNPVIIVNDSTSIFSEFTTGYGRGGYLGDSSIQSKKSSWGNALYLQNTSDVSRNSLNVNKLYTVLYSDALTYTIGRHSKNWGLGAVIDSGDNVWDRFSSIRDGITMELKIGNFAFAPYWAKISSEDSLTDSTKSKEYGISMLYDSSEKELAFGVLYNKKSNDIGNLSFETDITDTGTAYSFGTTDVKLLDIYFRKAFGPFSVALEFPLACGDIGNIYANNQSTKYQSKAILVESEYSFSESWKAGLDLGKVDGDSGSESSFDAMFLNPNYQIANILFRYNMQAINSPSTESLYDSYITNAKYLKLSGTFTSTKWILNGALIYAKANEVAHGGGTRAYNHSTNKAFTSQTAQSDDLGYELDFNFTYKWSDDVNLALATGYLFTGDYYAYTNDANINNKTSNVFLGQFRLGIGF